MRQPSPGPCGYGTVVALSFAHSEPVDLLSDLKISAYTITPRMFASALVHYNSSTTSVETNARLRWEYTPGSDLFVSRLYRRP